jgi:hypothetical protein
MFTEPDYQTVVHRHVPSHARTHTHTQAHAHAHTRTHTHTHTHIETRERKFVPVYSCMFNVSHVYNDC